jgi:hypothetical protein
VWDEDDVRKESEHPRIRDPKYGILLMNGRRSATCFVPMLTPAAAGFVVGWSFIHSLTAVRGRERVTYTHTFP